jgi:hypothetical protein
MVGVGAFLRVIRRWGCVLGLRAAFGRCCREAGPDRGLSHCGIDRDYTGVPAASAMHCIPSQPSAQACAFGEGADPPWRHVHIEPLPARRGGPAAPAPPGLVENEMQATPSVVPRPPVPSGTQLPAERGRRRLWGLCLPGCAGCGEADDITRLRHFSLCSSAAEGSAVTVVSRSGHGRVTVLWPNNPLFLFTFPNRVSMSWFFPSCAVLR